jgi:hypothetical protein
MKKWLVNSVRVCVLTATCLSTLAFADTGSERLDGQVAQLQRQIGARQQLSDDLNKDALALGYSVPEISINSNALMVAKADDDAFTMAMNHLQRTMTMFAMAD